MNARISGQKKAPLGATKRNLGCHYAGSRTLNCRGRSAAGPLAERLVAKVLRRVEIPWPWYKCQNSQNAQKCLRRVLKVTWGLPAESPKRVSRTVETLFRTGGNCLKGGSAPCKRLFWEPHPGNPNTPFAPSLKHFWAFWLF